MVGANDSRSLVVQLALALLACASYGSITIAQTFWVSATGSDSSGDGSSANPWATISHAIQNVPDEGLFESGDTSAWSHTVP